MIFKKYGWLIIGCTVTCNQQYFREYYRIHNSRLKLSPRTKPCIKCGKGTKNKYMICGGCGYQCLCIKEWRAARKE